MLEDVTITGDAALSLRAQNYCRVSNIDASEATGNLDIQHGSWPLQTAVLGSGNDVLETWQIRPDATVDGGDGNDSLIMADARGEYTLNMTNVATLGLMQTGNDVTIQGNNIDGMENLLLRNNWNGHDITIANFGQSELNVQAHRNNNLDLYVADITDMDIHVGDYNKNTIDNLTGTINLGAVTDLSITADDGINTDHQTYFTSVVNADKVQNLALSSSKESFVVVEDGSNLSSVANITASGYGDLFMGGGESLIGVNSGAVRVDASNMANGSFNGQFLGNRTQNASFAYTGSSLANNNVTVDSSYAKIAYTGGMGEDNLTLIADNTVYTKQNLTVDMRGGDDTLVIAGTLGEGCDFSGVKGLTRVEFVNMSPEAVAAANINWGDFTPTKSNISYIGDVIVTPGQPVDLGTMDDATNAPVNVYLAGGTPEITGTINKPNGSINLDAAANENTPSGLNVNFGQDGLEIEAAQNLVAIGGALQNKLQGEISNVSDVVNIDNSAGQAADVVDLTISNADNVNVTGNGNSASQFDVSVSNVGDATVNTGASATATVDVSGVSGTADVTVGASTAGPVRVIGGSGADDALTFEGNGSFAPTTQGVENFTVTGAGAQVNASNMQGVANLNVTGGNTVINGLSNTASDFVLTTNTRVALTNTNMDSVASLTVNNTATDGNVATVTGIPVNNTEGLPKTIGFDNVSSVKVTGSGNTELNGQFCKNGATVNMVVEDNGSVDMGGAGLTGSNLSYTNNGASGVDKICANMTSNDAGSSYSFNMGGGNDELVLMTTQAGGGITGSPATVSVDLGAGADVLVLAGQNGSTGWVNSAGEHYWGGKFAITVNGFTQGDQLKVGTANNTAKMVPGTFKDVSGYIDGTGMLQNTTDLAPFFSALSNGATATVASGDNRVLLVGNDAYAVYTVKADGTEAINTVIQLTGVQGVSSFIGSDYLLS